MSLVGPRPPLVSEVAGYDLWHRRRLSMKPGITGLWQVRARREPEFDRWVEDDLEYIDRWSLWLTSRSCSGPSPLPWRDDERSERELHHCRGSNDRGPREIPGFVLDNLHSSAGRQLGDSPYQTTPSMVRLGMSSKGSATSVSGTYALPRTCRCPLTGTSSSGRHRAKR